MSETIKTVIGCFKAAYSEGLSEALAETKDERLKDLFERRIVHALYAAQESLKTLETQSVSGQESVQIPAEIVKYAKAMQSDGYRGPLPWASKIIDFVANCTPSAPPRSLTDVQAKLVIASTAYGFGAMDILRATEAAHGIKEKK